MRIALVINATSGSVSGDLNPDTIRAKLDDAGFIIEHEADDQAALPDRLKAAAAIAGIAAVVVAGGDGTMACAAAVMAGHDIPLGLLPLGTMNLLAKDLGLPLDLDAAIATIKTGEPKRIDAADVNGHMFLISSMLGVPARMAEHREAQRKAASLRGAARFVIGLTRHIRRYPRLPVSIAIDGETRRQRVHMIVVVNNDFVEKPGKILVRDPVDGGRLTLYVAERLTAWRIMRLASGFALGNWHRLPGLERRVVDTLGIDTDHAALRVMNDGEIRLIEPPLRYTLRPRALAVIVPASEAGPT